MDLRQLRYFLAVAEERSFTRAAQRCNISQPPLSRAIRELEAELAAPLFERDKHHVRLTHAGENLRIDAARILRMAEEAAERTRQISLGLVGSLTVGLGGSTVYSLLPRLVREFREAVPNVTLRFKSMSVVHQIDALRSGDIDVGLLRMPIFDELIETAFVHSEPLVAALPARHFAAAAPGGVSVEVLAEERFVAYEATRGFNFHSDLLALCRAAGFVPQIVHEAPTTESVVGIVACGEGIAILPKSAERLKTDGVVYRPLKLSSNARAMGRVKFGLGWNRQKTTPALAQFLEVALKSSNTKRKPFQRTEG